MIAARGYPVSPQWGISRLPNQLVRVDSRTLRGVADGATQGTLSDLTGAGYNFAQGTGASKPTYVQNWRNGGPAFGFTTQRATATGPIIPTSGFSIACALQFSTTAAAHCAFTFGNAFGVGFEVNGNADGNRNILEIAQLFNTDGAATTSAELWILTYDSAATPKWNFYVNGVSSALASPNSVLLAPSGDSHIGANATSGGTSMSGKIGFLVACTGIWDATTRKLIGDDANRSWGIF